MLIRAGFDIAFECPAPTSMLLQLNVHPSRIDDLRSPDVIATEPNATIGAYIDHYGNRVTRLDVPAGVVSLRNDFVIYDSGEPDATPPDGPIWPVSKLPNDALMFLISSRYCDSDNLINFAWSRFGGIQGGRSMAQAICDFVHSHIRFNYLEASATRTASDAIRERVGVCRDFAHLAIALCRCMNIPARYCTGYLGDIGVPVDPAPMDFSAWLEVFLDGRWFTFDARHNMPRIGRVVMARGRDAADVALSTAFGVAKLARFTVTTYQEAA